MSRSECCGAKIFVSLGDGVQIGSCGKCGKNICRINPRTGDEEWLDGESPWTKRDDLLKREFKISYDHKLWNKRMEPGSVVLHSRKAADAEYHRLRLWCETYFNIQKEY